MYRPAARDAPIADPLARLAVRGQPSRRDDGLFVIGADASGRMLELVARPAEAGDLLVFHAMPLRPVNAKRYLP